MVAQKKRLLEEIICGKAIDAGAEACDLILSQW